MTNLANKDHNELIQYLFNKESGLALPKPYERDIFLFDTYVAGTTHVENIEAIGNSLQEGDKLVFYREPNNPHDPQAIRIETIQEVKIGYVPQQDNVIFSRLMDAGKALFGKVLEKEMRGNWLRIKIKIYLHES
ncbi:HIRAN domain-containing protein [Murdochiella vaginalis]|uniref:HIRAN domain-containing protein n=1 Tax=Murdochiella vaginalis TaxID=1852373 RepID=UPI0008FD9EE1|nr:HIRAN domain-containing protein [Murdochiella vaginalis]